MILEISQNDLILNQVDKGISDLSIVIVSYNTKDLTRQCLKNIEQYATEINHEIIVVDNASKDGSADMILIEFPNIRLIRLDENRGFSGGNIQGMKIANGRYILLLNSDAFISEGVLTKTLNFMNQNPKTGILGCKLIDYDGNLQASARMLPSPLNKILHITGLAAHFPKSRFFGRIDFSWWDHLTPKSVGWVVGAFFLIRRDTIEEIGYLDDRYFLYFEEIDYCHAARKAGWDVVFYPDAEVVHLGGQSAVGSGRTIMKEMQIKSIRVSSEFKYYRKFYGIFHVLLSASIELLWNVVIFIKNSIIGYTRGHDKREGSLSTIKIILSTLYNQKCGTRKRE
jgi:GT2 family glycosyltransferase